jgi:thiamine biosynthesis lipoprotein
MAPTAVDWRLAVSHFTRWPTTVELVVTEPRAVAPAMAMLEHQLDRVEQVASRFRADSELHWLHHRVAKEPGRAHVVSEDLFKAVTLAVRSAALTAGAVDPIVGGAHRAIGYDRDFSELADGIDGSLPEPQAVPAGRPSPSTGRTRPSGCCPAPCSTSGPLPRPGAADRSPGPLPTSWVRDGNLPGRGQGRAERAAQGFTVGIADVSGD